MATSKVTIDDCECPRKGSGSVLTCKYCHPDQGVVKRSMGHLLSLITSGQQAATRVPEKKKSKKK